MIYEGMARLVTRGEDEDAKNSGVRSPWDRTPRNTTARVPTPMMRLIRTALRACLNKLTGTGGTLAGATVHLYTTGVTPTGINTLSDFTEAAYTGYAASPAIVWSTAVNDGQGALAVGDVKEFALSADLTTPVTIYGYYLMSADTTPVLLGAEALPAPQSLQYAGDAVIIVPKFGMANQA